MTRLHTIPKVDKKLPISFFSYAPPRNLIIFLHGFMGDPQKSWDDFAFLMTKNPVFKYSDIVFYRYADMASQASAQASNVMKFVKKILTSGHDELPPAVRNIPRDYERIIFVAHALGAIVARRLLLDANKAELDWVHSSKMVLFAPAHHGRIIRRELLYGAGSIFPFSIRKWYYPVLYDMRPNSMMLNKIREETTQLLIEGDGEFTKAMHVIWPLVDREVHQDRFCEDPEPDLIADKDHFEICRPIPGKYEDPVDYVIKALK